MEDQNENSGITLLGDENAQAGTSEVETETVAEEEAETATEDKTTTPAEETSEESASPETKTETEKAETTDETEESSDESSEQKLEFSFEDQPSKETKQETVKEISDESVRSYLEDKHGVKIDKLSNLSKKEVLNDQVEAFKKFNEETNGTIADLYAIQRDWSKESDDSILANYYKLEDPNISDGDIADLIGLKKVSQKEKDDLEDRELRLRESEYKREVSKGRNALKARQEKYKVDLYSGKKTPKPETAEEIAEKHKPYWKARDKSLKGLTEFKMSIKDLGDVVIPITDKDRNLVAKDTQTLEDYILPFQNKDGSMNTDKAVRGTLYRNEDFFKRAIQSVATQVHALTLEKFSQENRNVDLEKVKKNTKSEQQQDEGIVVIPKVGKNEDFAPKPVF